MANEKKTTAKSRAADARTAETRSENTQNAVWFKPIMFGFMLIGLAWIIVYYVSGSTLPVPGLSSWNILIGFGIMFLGFLMTTRWK